MQITFELNGRQKFVEVVCNESLLSVLRRQNLASLKQGCDTASCGICTIWIDAQPVLACATLAVRVSGRRVTTIEGVADEAAEFAKFLVAEGSEQCGFCSPGLVMTVLAMRREEIPPTEEAIKHYINGNLCRCSGYASRIRAIHNYLNAMTGDKA
ncbi:MAG: 2Fe-2S iron-sulfur cluster binding domain-containing protein [Veillonellaceae bacterium]|nr:2Fe-2S iron-sulfur cluster binding domain-containing protein [Veillonellaceae bacterium]